MPLTGIRILDLTRLLPGAYCTLLLADMGADVIKVEEPGAGDYMRWTPPLAGGQSALFNAINRNKRSVTLNLKADAGRDLLLRLVEGADVLVEGNRPGVMDRLGLGWEVVHARTPLVQCHWHWANRYSPTLQENEVGSRGWILVGTAGATVRRYRPRSRSRTSAAEGSSRRSPSWAPW